MQQSKDRRLTTHSVKQSPLARFVLVPFHIGWHLAHHVDAGVPMAHLPTLHAELRRAGYVTDGLEYRSYTRFGASSRAVQASTGDHADRRLSTTVADGFDAAAQPAHRRLRNDPIDDDTVLALLDLAAHATTGRPQRCAFVVVRDPDVRHQLARTYRQGWSIYKRVLRSRWSDDALLEDRQWESDHFEDVPVLVVACLPGRRPLLPGHRRGRLLRRRVPGRPEPAPRGRGRAGLGASATTLPLWSVWEARRTLGLPRSVTPVSVVALAGPAGRLRGRGSGRAVAAGRQRRPPRPLGPPALSRPARPPAARTRHNGCHDFEAGDDVPRKGRARRFREARKLKQGYDDGLFREGSGTLADLSESADGDESATTTTSTTSSKTKRKTGTRTTS